MKPVVNDHGMHFWEFSIGDDKYYTYRMSNEWWPHLSKKHEEFIRGCVDVVRDAVIMECDEDIEYILKWYVPRVMNEDEFRE